MFEEDEEVTVKLGQNDNNDYTIKLFVNNNDKADALFRILAKEKQFGNVVVDVKVIPENPINAASITDLFGIAFEGNPALYDIVESETPFGVFNYVLFDKEVVQYNNDDISDFYGVKSTLYQDIAEDIFDENLAVYYCTTIEGEDV